jgi:hypothetical protein
LSCADRPTEVILVSSSKIFSLWKKNDASSFAPLIDYIIDAADVGMTSMIQYLSQGGPYHPKHGGGGDCSRSSSVLDSRSKKDGVAVENYYLLLPPTHPLLAFTTHYTIAITSIFVIHDNFFIGEVADGKEKLQHQFQQEQSQQQYDSLYHEQRNNDATSTFIISYTLLLFITRYISSYQTTTASSSGGRKLRYYSVLYELTWLCNTTLIVGCLSLGNAYTSNSWLLRRRPMVATAFCIAVSIDQVLWYIDALGYILYRTFPIGVMKYLTWKQTLWIDAFTCTHHLWTIPLFLYNSARNNDDAVLTWRTLVLSYYVVVVHVLLSRWLTPHHISSRHPTVQNDDGGEKKTNKNNGIDDYRYLNVNLAHELWQDITIPFLQISKDNPTCWVYLFRLLWRWQLFNTIVFIAILYPLSKYF